MLPAKEVVEHLIRLQAAVGGTTADLLEATIIEARLESARDMCERAYNIAVENGYGDLALLIRALLPTPAAQNDADNRAAFGVGLKHEDGE